MNLFFDAHAHIIDPRFPLVENDGYLPTNFTVADYQQRVSELAGSGVEARGGAIVSGSFQGFDQDYLVNALARLGEGFVGVTQLPADVSADQIRRLDAAGVRGIRFNLRRRSDLDQATIINIAHKMNDIAGWHAEFYIDSRDLSTVGSMISKLPSASIDHLGLDLGGLDDLLSLVDSGVVVKATGFGRLNFNAVNVVTNMLRINDRSVMAGTDLPSTRADRPFADSDIESLIDAVREEFGDSIVDNVLWRTARRFYRLEPDSSPHS